MKQRKLGPFQVSEIALGCMNLSHGYGTPPAAKVAAEVIACALDLGINHFDTAALYGFGANKTLLGPLLKPVRDRVILASKCGMQGVGGQREISNHPTALKQTLDDSLRRLDTDVIDLYYLHRFDKVTPIEDSVGALADMVTEGKIRSIGLSEVSAQTLRKAHAVHPVAAVQSEYSLWSRNAEISVLNACQELGISFVAFSPLGRGFLAGAIDEATRYEASDIRKGMPRFHPPNLEKNLALLPGLEAIAQEADLTLAQLALAWLLDTQPHLIALPGTTSTAHLREDVGASSTKLQPAVIDQLESLINQDTVSGSRYPSGTQAEIDTEEFAA